MVKILPIEFIGQGALLEPVDHKLHDMAVDYCLKELQGGDKLDLSKFQKVWVAVEIEDGEYQEILGITGWVWRIDIPVFRVTGDKVDRCTIMLTDRVRSYFEDMGARNSEVFLHVSSKERPEQRCQNWKKSLEWSGAVPADRFSIKV